MLAIDRRRGATAAAVLVIALAAGVVYAEAVWFGLDALGAGSMRTLGPNGSLNVQVKSQALAWPNHGRISVHDDTGAVQAGMFCDSYSSVVFADEKNFRMKHPTRAGEEIWYASLEGPEAAAYLRGTAVLVDGQAEIAFPEHFRLVASEQGMTLQVTPLSAESLGLAVVEKRQDGAVVRELHAGHGNYEFDYLVCAVRKGKEDYRVIRPALDEFAPSAAPSP